MVVPFFPTFFLVFQNAATEANYLVTDSQLMCAGLFIMLFGAMALAFGLPVYMYRLKRCKRSKTSCDKALGYDTTTTLPTQSE